MTDHADFPWVRDLSLTPREAQICRACGGQLEPILSLGSHTLADFPNSPDAPLPRLPLDLVRCTTVDCGLVQLGHTAPREWLYRHYWYRSGVNETMRAELRGIVEAALALLAEAGSPLVKHALVGDIGANDGTLLAAYRAVLPFPVTRVGWEPARNLFGACRPHCEVLYPSYFELGRDAWTAPKLDILTSIAMFYDLDDPNRFVADVAKLLAPKGIWCIQQAYLLDMLKTTGYDNIGHEHLEYYHLLPLMKLLAQHGLTVFHVAHSSINGGSFRTWIGWQGAYAVQPSVGEWLAKEKRYSAQPEVAWTLFQRRIGAQQAKLRAVLDLERTRGPIDLYAASTKSSTLLQTCGLDSTRIRQAWERSPDKLGRYVGATGIPIVSESQGRRDAPATLLVGAWQFREAFVGREQAYLRGGGRLLFPLPQVELVSEARNGRGAGV